MIVYSVTITIDDSVELDWLKWMKENHIPDVMNTGSFTSYRMLKVINNTNQGDGQSYNIQYDCPSMAELHNYQIKHAPKLQKEHSDRYKDKFAAFRTLLEKVE